MILYKQLTRASRDGNLTHPKRFYFCLIWSQATNLKAQLQQFIFWGGELGKSAGQKLVMANVGTCQATITFSKNAT